MISAEKSVSVVMPVHNAVPYLDESIASICNQTFSDFEFIIRDDHSTDGSSDVLRRWAERDDRIILHEGTSRLGPAGSADWVVRRASGSLIARMDADDVSHPERLQRQLKVLREQPDVVMVGTLFEGIDARGRLVRARNRSTLGSRALSTPFPHGSIMFRRDVFEQVGGYRGACDFWEDLDLYLRFAAFGRLVVLPEPLYRFRFSSVSTRLRSEQNQVESAVDLMFGCIEAIEKGESYEHLLERPRPADRKVRPKVFVSFGSIHLWSGRAPGTFLRLFHRSRLRCDLATLRVLIWAAWSTISPRSLRFALNLLLRTRDWRSAGKFPDGHFYDWAYLVYGPGVRHLAQEQRASVSECRLSHVAST